MLLWSAAVALSVQRKDFRLDERSYSRILVASGIRRQRFESAI
jgi:hypothetical protein